MSIKKMSALILSIVILSIITLCAQSSNATNTITKDELMKTDRFLASKELNGRLPGSPGYEIAADFMAKQLELLKFKPINDNGYFQKFKVEYNEILPGEHFSIIKDGKKTNYQLGKDYVYRGFTGSGNFSAPVVFCGYGLSQPELGYDDYAGIDVKGKVAMVYKYNPKWNIDGKTFTNGNPREKAIVAAKHGAIGILFISFPNDAEPQGLIGSVIHGDGEQMVNFPEIHIGLNLAAELNEGSGYSLKDAQTKIDSIKKPFSFSLKHKVEVYVQTKYEKEKEVENVCGILEGSDPNLKNEYLMVGAHLDHVGSQSGEIYFPGANDNASGSSALLQIARAFSSLNEKPKRSICFVFFASEEQGLNGSTYFANHLPFPKEKVVGMFNMDCVGYGDSIQIGGGESARNLWKVAKEIDSQNLKLMVTKSWKGGGADAEPFFQKGIPTLYFVTTNSYKHLHLTTDTPETLNQNLFEAITRLAFLTAFQISN